MGGRDPPSPRVERARIFTIVALNKASYVLSILVKINIKEIGRYSMYLIGVSP